MAVFKLLSAVFNGYCCAIQVNGKVTTKSIEKDMQDIKKSIISELPKVLLFSFYYI